MGIRVNKMVGYGLTDVQYDKYTLTDPRINPDGIVCQYEKYMNVDAWLAHLEDVKDHAPNVDGRMSFRKISATLEHQLIDLHIHKDGHPKFHYEPSNAVIWNPEGGLGNVLCVRPVAWTDWHRNDDTIDWCEETHLPRHESQRPWVELLPDGPFPHSGFWMDARDGKPLNSDDARHYSLMSANLQPLPLDDEIRAAHLDKLAQTLGFTDHLECDTFLAPRVPEEVQLLLEWGDAFTDPAVMWQLRPMLYTFWR